MMMNTGYVIVPSNHGLLSTVGYKLGSAVSLVTFAILVSWNTCVSFYVYVCVCVCVCVRVRVCVCVCCLSV